jgi:hypothetical protein
MNGSRKELQYDFNSLMADIGEVEMWLDSLGFRNNGRFRKYRSCVARMLHAVDAGRLEELQSSISDQDAREFFWSVVEGDKDSGRRNGRE